MNTPIAKVLFYLIELLVMMAAILSSDNMLLSTLLGFFLFLAAHRFLDAVNSMRP